MNDVTPGYAQLTLRLGTLLSGTTAPEWKNTSLDAVTIVDCYDVSGLRREAWGFLIRRGQHIEPEREKSRLSCWSWQ